LCKTGLKGRTNLQVFDGFYRERGVNNGHFEATSAAGGYFKGGVVYIVA
jgi:hypothetical protein